MPTIRRLTARTALPLAGITSLAILTGACSGETATPPTSVAGTAAPTTAAPSTSTSTSAAKPATAVPAPVTSRAPAGETRLVLRAGGLDRIDFGADRAATMQQLEGRFGPAVVVNGIAEVCPGYTIASWRPQGFSVVFAPENTFAGWDVNDAKAGATAEGVTVGTDVATLRRTYGERAHLEQSTLGDEFSVSPDATGERTFSGLVDDPGDKGRITSLWSGFICAAR